MDSLRLHVNAGCLVLGGWFKILDLFSQYFKNVTSDVGHRSQYKLMFI